MTLHLHTLKGCAPAPLANYLKALGILRLIGEQADKQARGWWQDEHFSLLTTLSREELETFFLERYQPTPIFNPWGARSGYYAGSPEKTARNALMAIEESKGDRLSRFRNAIRVIRSVVQQGGNEKPDTEESRSTMISRIRKSLRGSGSDWLDTVIADLGDSFRGPAILGTRGNEGSGSYTTSFMAAVVECFTSQTWNTSIAPSLWSDGSDRDSWDGGFFPPAQTESRKAKKDSVKQPFRQFLPSGKGSPWDLLLAFEGTIVIQSGMTRRSSTDGYRFLASPFYFAPLGIGAGSSSDMDEYELKKGRKQPGRGEQWFPLWPKPSTYAEVQKLFREGRCTVGRRLAKNPLDAARAICGLGTTRGISTFLRYGYLQRDNLASHFAVPLGKIRVNENSYARLVDDLLNWTDQLHRQARKKSAPARLVNSHKRLADSIFAALSYELPLEHSPARWQAILRAAATIETIQSTGTAIEAEPIPSLRPEWIAAVDDGSPEVRLALALGSAAAEYRQGRPIDPVRHHWLPLESDARRFKTSDKRLIHDSRVVMFGRDALSDFSAVVHRRLIEAGMKGERRSRMVAARGCGARLDDLAQFLRGSIDLQKLLGLARAFMAINWARWSPDHAPRAVHLPEQPEEAWLAIRLGCLPWRLTRDKDIPADPRIIRRLIAGDSVQAIKVAIQRLRSAGIRPPLQAGVTDVISARRWAAALAFPINHVSALRAAAVLDPSMKGLLHA